jgi:ammonia channel protein AmtB
MADKDSKRKEGGKKRQTAPFTTVNYVLFTLGLAMVVAGWFLLRAGSITAAPIMLVLGYCGVIPLAIVYRPRRGSRSDT